MGRNGVGMSAHVHFGAGPAVVHWIGGADLEAPVLTLPEPVPLRADLLVLADLADRLPEGIRPRAAAVHRVAHLDLRIAALPARQADAGLAEQAEARDVQRAAAREMRRPAPALNERAGII